MPPLTTRAESIRYVDVIPRPLLALLLVLAVAMAVLFLMPRNPTRGGIVWDRDFASQYVRQGDEVEEKFEFTNHTGRAISIVEVVPSCSCSSAKFAPESVPDGGRGSVTVRIDTAKRRAPASIRTIVRFDSGDPSVVTLNADLRGTVRLSTDQLKWTSADAGKPQSVVLDFSDAPDAEYLSYDISGEGYRVERVSGWDRKMDFQLTPGKTAPKEAFLRLHWRQGGDPFVSNVLLINRVGQ
jgi:hypothetical protein